MFRIVTQRRVADAFSGEGARLFGGRWNPKGVRVVYAASSRALAMLEMLAQDQPLRAHYLSVPARIPAAVHIERVAASRLPADLVGARAERCLACDRCGLGSARQNGGSCVPSAVVPRHPRKVK